MVTEEAFVIPVAKRRGGVLLVVPVGFIPEKELEEGLQASEDAVIGPSRLLKLPGEEEDDNGTEIPSEADVPVILVDFNMSVFQHLKEYDPSTDTQMIQSFLDDAPQIMPMSSPLLQQALEWMTEEVSGRLQFYSAEEQVPMTPVPPTKKETKPKRVTTAALADQISELSRTLPTLVQELQALKDKQAQFEGAMAATPVQKAEPPPHRQPFPVTGGQSSLQEFMKVVGPSPKVKATPTVVPVGPQMDVQQLDDPNLPVEDLAGAFGRAAQPSMTQAILQQSQAMNALVAHLVGAQDPLHDLASSSTSALSTKGAGKRERLQQELASRSGGFFLQVAQLALRRIKPLDPLPRTLDDLPKKAIFSKYLEKQGGFCRSEGVCHPHVVAGADWRRYGGEGSWWSSRIAGPYAGKPRASQPRRGKMGPRISSFSTRRTSPGTLHVSDFKCQSSAQSICSVMPPALGNVCPGVCQGDGCDFHPPCRDISTTSTPEDPGGEGQASPKENQIPEEAKEGRGRSMSPSRPDGGLRSFDPLSPRKEAHPSLGSGPYVCKAGESKDGLSSEWTFLQSYSFRRWCASLPRTVLSSRTAFSAFLLRTFHISRSDSQAPAKLLFPLPVPKCGIFEALPPRCSSRHRRRVEFDRAFHVLIMALNFLHDDFHFVDLAKLSFVPNPAQKVALSNLRGLLKAFGNCAGEIHVPASGRRSTALVAMLADLSEFFTTRGLSGDAYEIGFNGADNLPPGEVQVDNTRAEELLPYRSLDPSRLKLTGCANWDPSSYLDDSLWLPFVEPSVLLWTSLFDESDLPNLDKEDPQKVLELAKIWDARGLLHLSTTQVPEEMKPACLRVFNCYKGPLQDRQIGDKRGRNQIEAYLPGPSRSLPCGHQLTVLEVNPLCEKVAVCMSDRKDFYHQLQVTQARAESNVLWPPLSTAALVHTQAYKDLVSRIEKSKKRGPREAVGDFLGGRPIPSGGSKIPEKVHACFNSVIQGDHLGVEIATQSHSNLLKRNGLLCGEEELTSTRPFRGSGCLQGLVIDDFFSVSIEKDVPAKQNGRQSAARKRFEVAKKVYESEGLIGSSEKDVVDQ